MRISDWSSDVCSSDLANGSGRPRRLLYDDGDGDQNFRNSDRGIRSDNREPGRFEAVHVAHPIRATTPRSNIPRMQHSVSRSEEHTSELQSLMRISYAVFCLKKKQIKLHITQTDHNTNNK